MINNQRAIGIIPARGGSRGLPGKNIRELCGKPLIAWTIEKALGSKYLDQVIVSTDSRDIADISVKYGAAVPFLRPANLASDIAPTSDVIDHALAWFEDNNGESFDYIVVLEPTSPLREDDDIDRMLTMLSENQHEFDAIVSVGEVSEHPSIVKRINGVAIEPYCPELTQTTRRQDNVPAFFPYGVAYIVKVSSFIKDKTLYPERCMSFPIKRYQNYEIDDLYDFLCIESVMKYEWGLK